MHESMSKDDKELVGASTELLILSCLSHKPSYGYDIVRQANERSDGEFSWQEGTLYPVLHKLEAARLVRSQWQETENGRRRKYYYITATGRKALEEKARRWNTLHDIIFGMLANPSPAKTRREET